MLKSLCLGEMMDKLEAAKGQVTKIDDAVCQASVIGLQCGHACQLQNTGPPACGAVWPVGRLGTEESVLWTHCTSSVPWGMELISSQLKHCFHSGTITCNVWTIVIACTPA